MVDDVARALRQLRMGTAARKLESPTLDFKAPSGNPKATFTNIVEAVVCFANSAGGTVVRASGTARRRHQNYRLRGHVLAQLGPALAYHRAPSDERDRKIVEHLSEYGSINNRTVQNLFDVDVFRASAVLRDLVERDVLVQTSEQTRGNAVRYGPGPAFRPSSRK